MSSFGGSGPKVGKVDQFVLGGLSAMLASCVTHPIDLIKVRMQLAGELSSGSARTGAIRTMIDVSKKDGISGLYKGLSASLLRQATYSSTRLGAYGPIKDMLTPKDIPNAPLSLPRKLLAGMLAGGCGALVGSPADLVMVRMQADGRLPLEQRRNYSNVFSGLMRITKEENLLALWRGSGPNIFRAMLMSAAQLSSYDQMKQVMLKTKYFKDDLITHFLASFSAGFIATVVTSPIDVAKTRIMNQKPDPVTGQLQYKGVSDCLIRTMKSEGFIGLYKGFVPNFMRLGPQTVLMFVFLEQLTRGWAAIRKSVGMEVK
jgi:solute carrier family 25 oxoglutarate transporter 11